MSVTDIIHLNHEQDLQLVKLWETGRKAEKTEQGYLIPADLFFAKTLPLHDFEIELDERDQIENGLESFAFFEIIDKNMDGIHRTLNLPDGQRNIRHVMNMYASYKGFPYGFVVHTGIEDGNDYLFGFEFFVATKSGNLIPLAENAVKHLQVDRMFGLYMETWYGIEVAMLHPTVKDIFLHPTVKKDKIPKKDRAEYGHKIYRYVKHHYIQTDELNDAIYGKGSHSFNRKALIWYVSGHWREYKTGKKIFIQPYWKGALRATKKAAPRNREIVTEREVSA